MHELVPPKDLAELEKFSAGIGANPLLIQAAGGNTSVKDGGTMWIKASGTVLADAGSKDIFVPVDLPAMRAALDDPDTDADQPAQFLLGGHALRPSIETSLHAVFPHRVVAHVHCVQTLAHAIRTDAETVLKDLLSDFDFAQVPYAKPGANLARMVRAVLGPRTNVVVLRNHGLIVAADSVAEGDELLSRVVETLSVAPAPTRPAQVAELERWAGAGWYVPDADAPVHQLALDEARVAQAIGGSLYPDHVIFCGMGAKAAAIDALPAPDGAPVFLIVPGKGVILREDASSSAHALARCLSDVLVRVPGDTSLHYLTLEQNAELLDWDAEKYRQALNA